MSKLSEDRRPIESIWYDDEEHGNFWVGRLGVTRIEPYDEYGEMAPVPWLAVYKGDFLMARVPARKVTVVYQETGAKSSSDFDVDDLIAGAPPS